MIYFETDIDTAVIEAAFMRAKKKAEDMVIAKYKAIGSQALELALSSEAYRNITGNLRSSIGYGIFRDGEEIYSDGFIPFDGPAGNGSLGVAQGRESLRRNGSKTKGIALVLVAGSDHAVKVESEGKVVLSDAMLLVESLLRN